MEEEENFGAEPRVYELGYLIRPDIAEDKVGEEVTKLKDMFESKGGVFISDEFPRLIELSYEMRPTISNKNERFTNGYFGWIKYELLPESAESLNKDLLLSTTVFRFLLIKTIRENTVASKKPLPRKEMSEKKAESVEPVAPIDAVELDKEIDALVAE